MKPSEIIIQKVLNRSNSNITSQDYVAAIMEYLDEQDALEAAGKS